MPSSTSKNQSRKTGAAKRDPRHVLCSTMVFLSPIKFIMCTYPWLSCYLPPMANALWTQTLPQQNKSQTNWQSYKTKYSKLLFRKSFATFHEKCRTFNTLYTHYWSVINISLNNRGNVITLLTTMWLRDVHWAHKRYHLQETMSPTTLLLEISLKWKVLEADGLMPSSIPKWLYLSTDLAIGTQQPVNIITIRN